MSTLQPNLHKYFKVKKNSNVKDGKINSNIKKDLVFNNRKPQIVESNSELGHDAKVQTSKSVDINESNLGTSISSAEENTDGVELVSLPSELVNNTIEECKTLEQSKIEASEVSEVSSNEKPECTPTKEKSNDGEIEIPSRKRKREQVTDLETDPETPKKVVYLDAGKDERETVIKSLTAKKCLLLSKEITNQKKLNPETIKKELGKCGRLDELRSRLLKLNQCEEKLQAFRSKAIKRKEPQITQSSPKKQFVSSLRSESSSLVASKSSQYSSPIKDKKTLSPYRLKSFHSLDIEVPISPTKSPAKARTPVKSSYERFSHLSEPSDQLQLPYRFQMVKEVFRAVDTVVSLLHNRQELVTYSKLKPAVQEMLRKTFSETHLGQLKTVFPMAYFFSQEKIRSSFKAPSYQLTVKPNLNYPKEPSATRNLMQELEAVGDSYKFRKMDSIVLVERRHIFHKALLGILKKHHDKFLKALDPPIELEGQLRRWHPEFPLEEVSPPAPSPLPQAPLSSETIETAKDVLDKARDIFSVNNRMKEAVEIVASTSAGSSTSVKPLSAVDNGAVTAALKGVSLSLLEKIRAREAAKATREMTRSSGASLELEMLSRLPELARILRSMFVTEKKAALSWESVTAKIVASHSGSLSISEAGSHLNLLMKEVPGWCTSHKVRSGTYLKIDKTQQLHSITEKLSDVIKAKT